MKTTSPVYYDVAYPYGVGGNTILDMFTVDFDNWVINNLLGYFIQRQFIYIHVDNYDINLMFDRFITGPFMIPSLTALLGQAFTAVTGQDFESNT